MVSRAFFLLVAGAASGCALVSGLSGLTVRDDDASASDAGGPDDVNVADTIAPPDGGNDDGGPPEGGRAGFAIQTGGGGATTTGSSTFWESDANLSVAFWLRVEKEVLVPGVSGIVWKGGRSTAEPGWSIDLETGQGSGLLFCAADTNLAKCTTPYAIVGGDLVHVVATTSFQNNVSDSRTLQLYARDVTKGETTHTLVGSATSAATI